MSSARRRRRPAKRKPRRSPAQEAAAIAQARLEALRRPKIRPGSIVPYVVDGKAVRGTVIRQTKTGRITIRIPGGQLRSILPGRKRGR